MTAKITVITMTATTVEKSSKVSLTEGVTYKNAERTANVNGKYMGTAKVIFDLPFIKSVRNSWIFVHWKDAPTELGWHQVIREDGNHVYKKITEEQAGKLEWHEKIYVHESTLKAIKEKRPLALDVAYYYCDYRYRLYLYGDYGADGVARVAQVDAGHEAAAPQIASILRVEKGKTVVLTSPNGEKTKMEVAEGTTVELE